MHRKQGVHDVVGVYVDFVARCGVLAVVGVRYCYDAIGVLGVDVVMVLVCVVWAVCVCCVLCVV